MCPQSHAWAALFALCPRVTAGDYRGAAWRDGCAGCGQADRVGALSLPHGGKEEGMLKLGQGKPALSMHADTVTF